MLKLRYSKQFKQDYKLALKRGKDEKLFIEHIQPDWLLIYRINNDELILELFRTGSHSDLFGK